MNEFIPGCRARKYNLSKYTHEVHPSENRTPIVQYVLGSKEPYEGGNDERKGEMSDAVWDPGKNVENGMCEACEDVRYVRTIEYGLKSGEESNGDIWSPFSGYETGGIEGKEICKYWCCGNEKL